MNPIRLALVWCAYAIIFFIIFILLEISIPETWVFKKLSNYPEFIDGYGSSTLYFDGLWLLSLLINSVVIWLTAGAARKFIKPDPSQNMGTPRKKFKLILVCYAYSATYTAAALLLYLYLPEMWLYRTLSDHTEAFIGEILWDDIYMSLVFILSLLINGFVIFLTVSATKKLFLELKRWHRSPMSD
jgi:hypothetical protein